MAARRGGRPGGRVGFAPCLPYANVKELAFSAGKRRDKTERSRCRGRLRPPGRLRQPSATGRAKRGPARGGWISGETGRFAAPCRRDEAATSKQVRHEGRERQPGLSLCRPTRLQLRLFRHPTEL